MSVGELDEAERMVLDCLEARRRVQSDDHPRTGQVYSNLGLVLQSRRQFAEAEPYFRQALEVYAHALPAGHQDVLITTMNPASSLEHQGRLSEAETLTASTLEHLEEGNVAPSTARLAFDRHALLTLIQKRFEEAEILRGSALDAYVEADPENRRRYYVEGMLGACLLELESHGRAEPLLLEGYDGLVERRATIPHDGLTCIELLRRYLVRLYEEAGDLEAAGHWRNLPADG
jgi:tetratricopeptide (TPR) repeat protein